MTSKSLDLVLITPSQMQIIDQEAAKKNPIRQLMENAGWAVAQEIIKHYKACFVLVLCGPGNNGGDGYVVARLLAKAGWPVCIAAIGKPRVGSECEYMAHQWNGRVVDDPLLYIDKADLVIDAIYGAGLSRDLNSNVIQILSKAKKVIAIDIPSGIDGASGQVRGYAPRAELTISFFRAKPGHYLMPGREYTGDLIVKDIGILTQTLNKITVNHWLNAPGLWEIPGSDTDDNKYRRGTVSIVGGSEMTGAARLSAQAALNTGAGLVHIYALGSKEIYSNSSACFVVDQTPLESSIQDKRRKVWVCGPGLLAYEVQNILPILISSGKQVIADAGVFQTGNIEQLKGVSVITPHMGEFERVFGKIKGDKISAAKQAATQIDAVVILKGADTVIAAPDGRVAINKHASARLATAGSGDILTGIIATLLASGMSTWHASCAGVWVHGEAAYLCDHSWPDAKILANNLSKARDNAKTIKISKILCEKL